MTKEVSCFSCSGATGTLHQASTLNVDVRVPECAHQLQDEVLIAILSAGDLMSQETVYPAKCLVLLCNKTQRLNQNPASSDVKVSQGMALAQLVAYLEETRAESCRVLQNTVSFFIPYVTRELKSVKWVDVVWGRYLSNSLKDCT